MVPVPSLPSDFFCGKGSGLAAGSRWNAGRIEMEPFDEKDIWSQPPYEPGILAAEVVLWILVGLTIGCGVALMFLAAYA